MIEVFQKSEHQIIFESVNSELAKSIFADIKAEITSNNEKVLRLKEILKFEDERFVIYDSFINYNQKLQDTFLIEVDEKFIKMKAIHSSMTERQRKELGADDFSRFKVHMANSSIDRSAAINLEDVIESFKAGGSAMAIIQSCRKTLN